MSFADFEHFMGVNNMFCVNWFFNLYLFTSAGCLFVIINFFPHAILYFYVTTA